MGEVENLENSIFASGIFVTVMEKFLVAIEFLSPAFSFEASIAEATGLSRAQLGQLLFFQEPLLTFHAKWKGGAGFSMLVQFAQILVIKWPFVR